MAGDKYLYNNAGTITERALNQTSAGAGDAGKGVALDSGGKISPTMLPAEDVISCLASEDLAAGDYVNLHLSAGVIKARKADATTAGKEANGYVTAAFLTGATATVFGSGSNTGVAGKTIGATQYLSTTPGATQETAPSAAGNVVQRVGKALTATEIFTEFGERIVVA